VTNIPQEGFTAVWNGASGLGPRMLEEEWLTVDLYREVGPSIIEDLRYSGSL